MLKSVPNFQNCISFNIKSIDISNNDLKIDAGIQQKQILSEKSVCKTETHFYLYSTELITNSSLNFVLV